MTPFEYVAIATSLILSFSFARTISNLAPIFLSRARYWVHSAWVVQLLMNHLIIFFGTGTNHQIESWTFARVCGVLVVPVCTLIAASLAVPHARAVRSYSEHFASIRVPFYGIWAVSILASALGVYTLGFADAVGLAALASVSILFLLGAVLRSASYDKALVVFNGLWYVLLVLAIWDAELFDPMILQRPL